MSMPIPSSALKENLKNVVSAEEITRIRIHRAISWLKGAEECGDNIDLKFITLWISFNAGYAGQNHEDYALTEEEHFKQFIHQLVSLDYHRDIFNLLWDKFSGPVRLLIENQYAFKPFWSAQRHENINWKSLFGSSNRKAFEYLANEQVADLLGVVLDRLYTVRNQLIHGGATYQSNVNRSQVRDACQILAFLIPILIGIMIDHSDKDWGAINYPVISD